MIRIHHYILVLSLVIVSIALISYINREKTSTTIDQNISYEENVESALECAMATVDYKGVNVFDTEDKRRDALKAFYGSYEMTQGLNRNKVDDKMPFVILLDNNGYYVCYDEGGSYYTSIISPIHKWATVIGDFNVEFELNGNITARYLYGLGPENEGRANKAVGSDTRFRGTVDEVIAAVAIEHGKNHADSLKNGLKNYDTSFSGNKDEYLENTNQFIRADVIRQDIINQSITDTVNYYVNNFNERNNDYEAEYIININGSTQDAQRKILRPTIMAFTQGPQKNEINIFAYVGTEVAPKDQFCIKEINGTLMYHTKDCESVSETVFYSMEECAKKGAYPHNCIR